MGLNFDQSSLRDSLRIILAMFVTDLFNNSLRIRDQANLIQNGLNCNKSPKGVVPGLNPLLHLPWIFSTIVLGVQAPNHHLMMDFNTGKPMREASGTLTQAM
jgi:hypothetical protein